MVVKKLRPRIPLPRTLRGRLITGLVALLALGCATVGLVTYFAVQRTLSGELNSELQTATGLAYNCWATGFHSNADSDAQSSQQLTGGAGAATGPSPSSVPSASGGANPSSSPISTSCTGLGEGTFVAVIKHGKPQCLLIGEQPPKLSTADTKTLLSITPSPDTPAGGGSGGGHVPTITTYLGWAHGSYLLTAILDPDGDGNIYITGLPLSSLHDF